MTVSKERIKEIMIAPGIRVVRGPDWIWQIQGKDVLLSYTLQQFTLVNIYIN